MIYLVSLQNSLFEEDETLPYTKCTIDESLNMILSWDVVQYDSETTGRDPHICKLLCVQFGNRNANCQIVVDTTTVNICAYKKVFETKLLIGHNLKFDFQFLYKFNIVPVYCYDTMIIEQLLHLGYNNKYFRYSLKAVAERRLGIDIDKSTRGEIIWRGLDPKVIVYAAGDVQYLEDLRDQQLEEAKYCKLGVDVENNFVPVIAYLEYSGFHLDEKMWHRKMQFNVEKMQTYMKALNEWVIEESAVRPEFKKYTTESEEDLFADMFPTECTINWSSPLQVTQLAQELGFDTKVEDKKTGESKDSIVEKQLTKQTGICDTFLNLYFQYQEAKKECSTYGSNYLDAINPLTGRLHTTFKQLGASSGRMSCGSTAHNTDLARFKGISESRCIYPQIQNLPSKDDIDGIKGYTRHCFTAMDGNLLVACDFSALESRLGADIYNEPAMIKEYNEGSGDIHSLTAKICFKEELRDVEIKDIKKLRPDLRQKAKGPEFACQFGGGAKAIANTLGIPYNEAKKIENAYKEGFKGIATFKQKGSEFVRSHGYVVICKKTGHRVYWEDWKEWKQIEQSPEGLVRQEYSADEIKEHNMAAAKWDRMALNSPTQGTGIIILKYAMILFFRWIVKNGYFGKVLLCDLVHDEAVVEFPEELRDVVPAKLQYYMEYAASQFCSKVKIPAVPEVGKYWIH